MNSFYCWYNFHHFVLIQGFSVLCSNVVSLKAIEFEINPEYLCDILDLLQKWFNMKIKFKHKICTIRGIHLLITDQFIYDKHLDFDTYMTDMIYVVAFPLVSYCKGREMFNKVKLEAGISVQHIPFLYNAVQ